VEVPTGAEDNHGAPGGDGVEDCARQWGICRRRGVAGREQGKREKTGARLELYRWAAVVDGRGAGARAGFGRLPYGRGQLAIRGCAIDGQRKERGIGEEGKWREAVLTGGTRGVVRAKRVRRCGRGVADVRASCAARERGAERRALKAERTGVRGWAAALKVEQAGAEQQLAGRVGGLPSRSG